jgi:hypothetical protein
MTIYFIQGNQCSPPLPYEEEEEEHNYYSTTKKNIHPSTFANFCDAGVEHTPILPDHRKLVPYILSTSSTEDGTYLPCHFHTREGVRILSLHQLASYAREVKAKAVAAAAAVTSDGLSCSSVDSTANTETDSQQ